LKERKKKVEEKKSRMHLLVTARQKKFSLRSELEHQRSVNSMGLQNIWCAKNWYKVGGVGWDTHFSFPSFFSYPLNNDTSL
jgi:hypothetical protein